MRPAWSDDLGLRRGVARKLLPFMVGAMAFLASLALAGAIAAAAFSRQWQDGPAAALTVQVPDPAAKATDAPQNRLDRVVALLSASPGIARVQALSHAQIAKLLQPWLGSDATQGLALPAVVAVRAEGAGPPLAELTAELRAAAPGTLVDSHGDWTRRIAALAHSVQALAWAMLALVTGVAAAVVTIATRAGLVQRRDAVLLVHGLGATDADIARRFAARATRLAFAGGLGGCAVALPVLAGLAALAAPLVGGIADPAAWMPSLPRALWFGMAAIPLVCAALGFATAQVTVRAWLRPLP
ncbi:MAG: cell division protein FtsX [Rhodospirillales bacterium]|nr:cell division protein FtsX [Rhodospirillales bacterium]